MSPETGAVVTIFLLGLSAVCIAQDPDGFREPFSGIVLLEYSRSFGRALLRECTTTIVLHADSATSTATFRGILNTREAQAIEASANLEPQEVSGVRALLRRARVFDPPHSGLDRREADGVFCTLTVNDSVKAVVLVVSGNDSFSEAGPRRELVEWLSEQSQSLYKQAMAGQPHSE